MCSFAYYSHHFKIGRGQLVKGDVMYLSPIKIKKQLNQYVMTVDGLFAFVAVLQFGLFTVAQLLIFSYYYLNVIPNLFKKNQSTKHVLTNNVCISQQSKPVLFKLLQRLTLK